MKINRLTEVVFLTSGYTNWKDATRNFAKHKSCEFHKQAVGILSKVKDVSEIFSSELAADKEKNRAHFLKVLSSIRYLAHQGLPMRGGNDTESNLFQLMSLRKEDFEVIDEFLDKKQLNYTSHEIKNEVLSIMSQSILRDKVKEIQFAVYFTIMVDETTDMLNKEQVVILFCWVSDQLVLHEDFIGLYETHSIEAKVLVDVIKDTLLRLNLKLQHCRGQCYDGASSMSGIRNGVAKSLMESEPHAVYTHCYGHCLNLAIGDTIKNSKVMKSCLEIVYEITKLIKKSPK